jgi:16S rRNA (cytosine967-C5)-methyltransferase
MTASKPFRSAPGGARKPADSSRGRSARPAAGPDRERAVDPALRRGKPSVEAGGERRGPPRDAAPRDGARGPNEFRAFRDAPRGAEREAPIGREAAREAGRDAAGRGAPVREGARSASRDTSRDSRENPRAVRDTSMDNRENPNPGAGRDKRTRAAFKNRDVPADTGRDAPRDNARDGARDAPRDASGERSPRPSREGQGPARNSAARPMAIRIEQVRDVLGEVLQWAGPADLTLSRWFRANPRVGMRDRGEIAEAVYDVLRHLRRYRQVAEGGRGAATRRLAVLGLAATMRQEVLRPALEGEESAWLTRVLAIDPKSMPLAVRQSVPDWLEEALRDEPEPERLFAALNRSAPLDIRVNPMKADRDQMIAELMAGAPDADVAPTPYSPYGIRLQGRPALNRWVRFEDGSIEVQDEGSQLLTMLVAPRRGEMVIDFCAGAGGKTLLLGAMMRSTGRLYALDVSENRLSRFKPRLARSGLSNVFPVVIANENDARVKRLSRKAHRVLVDAPCSGTGTLRRNADLKWRQNPDSVQELVALQHSILASAARCVAPGGRLVYGTCSLLREENEAQAETFLAENPDFELLPADEVLRAGRAGEMVGEAALSGPFLKLRPDVHGTDGFFAAVFQRKAAGVTAALAAEAAADPAVAAVIAMAEAAVVNPAVLAEPAPALEPEFAPVPDTVEVPATEPAGVPVEAPLPDDDTPATQPAH